MIRIKSRVLGCEVGIVHNEDERRLARENGCRLVLYSRDELERMRGLLPDVVKSIHEVKEIFGGVYEGPAVREGADAPGTQVDLFNAVVDSVDDGQELGVVEFKPPPEWGDEVITPSGMGIVVGVTDTEVTTQLYTGGRVKYRIEEVQA